jgi:hypothetical protein
MISFHTILLWFLFCLLGFGPFAVSNGLWCEEPFLELTDASGNNVGAWIGGWYNGGFAVLLLYFLFVRFVRGLNDAVTGGVCLLLGAVGGLVAAFLHATLVDGRNVFIWIASLLAGVCGTLNVFALFSFAGEFPAYCTAALGVGMNLNGIIVAVLGNVQQPGVASQMRFSFTTMMLISSGTCVLSVLVLVYLQLRELPRFKSDRKLTLVAEQAPLINNTEKAATANEFAPLGDWPDRHAPPRHLIRLVASPLACSFITSAFSYFFNPALVPFLAKSGATQSHVITTFMVASTLGSFVTAWIKIRNLWLVTFFVAIAFWYLFAVAFSSFFPAPTWLLYPATATMAFLNAYVTTAVFVVVTDISREAGRTDSDAHRARHYAAVLSQLGLMVGTYLCVGVALMNWFRAKSVDN